MFTYPIEIAASPEVPFDPLEPYVDSGAAYTQIAASELERLGVKVIDTATFVTADGHRTDSDIGELVVHIDGRERRTLCIFSEEGVPPLLGAYTLEAFLLSVDPVNARLIPIEGLRL